MKNAEQGIPDLGKDFLRAEGASTVIQKQEHLLMCSRITEMLVWLDASTNTVTDRKMRG